MREIIVRLKEDEYHMFLRVSDNYGLKPEEKIMEMITYYIIIEKNKNKLKKVGLEHFM